MPKADIRISFVTNITDQILGQAYYPAGGGSIEFNDRVDWTVDAYHGDFLKIFSIL